MCSAVHATTAAIHMQSARQTHDGKRAEARAGRAMAQQHERLLQAVLANDASLLERHLTALKGDACTVVRVRVHSWPWRVSGMCKPCPQARHRGTDLAP